jgi:hypothetical protein
MVRGTATTMMAKLPMMVPPAEMMVAMQMSSMVMMATAAAIMAAVVVLLLGVKEVVVATKLEDAEAVALSGMSMVVTRVMPVQGERLA